MKNKIIKIINNDLFIAIFLFVVSVFIKYIFPQVINFKGNLWSDDANYMSMARSIKEGNYLRAFHPHWPPFYPFLSFLLEKLTQNWYAAAVSTSVLANCFLVVPIFFLTKKLSNRLFAVLSSFFVFTFFPINLFSFKPLTESLYICLTWLSLSLGVYSLDTKKHILPILTGLSFALVALTRSEGILIFASFFAIYTTISIIKKNLTPLIILFSFLAIYAPYQIILTNKYGRNVSAAKAIVYFKMNSQIQLNSNKTSTFAQDIYSLDTFNVNSEFLNFDLTSYLKTHYPIIIKDWGTRNNLLVKDFLSETLPVPQAILVGLGLAFLVFQSVKKPTTLLIFSLAIGIVFTMLFAPSFDKRYTAVILPSIPILFTLGIYFLTTVIKDKAFKFILLSPILIYFIITNGKNYYSSYKDLSLNLIEKQDVRNNPEFIKLLKGKTVMLVHEGYAFNSESKIIYTPLIIELKDLVDYANKWKVDYLIATPEDIPYYINYLLTKPGKYQGVKPIFGVGTGLIVYEFQYKK